MRPIADNLFTQEVPPRLIGGRHRQTGRIVFPCPPRPEFESWPLARRGTIWSFTIQRFRPKSPPYIGPEAFHPWPVAYVELPGETIVQARLIGVAPDDVRIGMEVELAQTLLDPDAADPLIIHAFKPLDVAL